MKKLKLNLPKLSKKQKVATVMIAIIGWTLLILTAINSVATWFRYNTLEIKKPYVVDVKRQAVINITHVKDIKPAVEYIYVGQEELDKLVENSGNKEVAEKIIDAFGPIYGPRALEIFTGESGLNCHAWNANTNDSIDIGLVQANSIHFNEDFTIADALDCDKSIAWAEKKARADALASGSNEKYVFGAWVVAQKLGLAN